VSTRIITRAKAPGLSMKYADYAAAPGCNFSTLKHMARSPLHYRHALQNPPTETTAMLLGRATHTTVFEPQRLELEYAVWSGDRRGNAFKEFEEACTEQGRSILKEGEYQTVLDIRDSVRRLPIAAELLLKGNPETSLFWRNPPTGVACKGRLDWISSSGVILDLKTTTSIDAGWFSSQAWRMGYFHQAAMYQEGYAVSSGKGSMLRFGIIAVEQNPPHACRLFWLDEESMERAWREYVGWLEKVQECSATGIWPGPEPVETELAAPSWATAADEDPVDFDGVEEEDVKKAG
jgi:hypothetical protein